MANGRHARGAEHPSAQLDPGPADKAPVGPREVPVPTGRRRRVMEEPTALVTEVPQSGPANDSISDAIVLTGTGRRRRAAVPAALPTAETALPAPEAALPAPTGRRRRAPEVEAAATFLAATPAPTPGTGRRRRTEAPVVTEPVRPVVEVAVLPVVEPVVEPVGPAAESALAPVTELAPRTHRRAAAKPAGKKSAPTSAPKSGRQSTKQPAPGHAARTSGGHAGERRKVVALPGAPSGTALIAGAAAVAVAAAGAIGAANSGSNLAPTAASMTGPSVLGLSEGGALVDSASVDREQARASRERARDALADRVRAAAAAQKKQEAAARALAAAKARAQQLALMAKDYSLPVSNYRLTAGFGAGGYRWSHGHTGLDFACAYGSPIRAVATGTVIFAGWDGAYGYKTVIRHLDGTESWYAHQSQFLVRRGQVVAGQIIGRVGMTGNTSGPHLHLEIRVKDKPISPFAWLRAHGLRP